MVSRIPAVMNRQGLLPTWQNPDTESTIRFTKLQQSKSDSVINDQLVDAFNGTAVCQLNATTDAGTRFKILELVIKYQVVTGDVPAGTTAIVPSPEAPGGVPKFSEVDLVDTALDFIEFINTNANLTQ